MKRDFLSVDLTGTHKKFLISRDIFVWFEAEIFFLDIVDHLISRECL